MVVRTESRSFAAKFTRQFSSYTTLHTFVVEVSNVVHPLFSRTEITFYVDYRELEKLKSISEARWVEAREINVNGQRIAVANFMKRTAQLLTCALMFTSSSAFADAITGAPPVTSYSDAARTADGSDSNSSVAPEVRSDGAMLFDASGASLLVMSPPQFLFVGAHSKLRGGGGEFGTDGLNGSGGGGGSLLPGGVLNGLTSGVSSGTLGNVGFSTGGGTAFNPTTAPAAVASPEPASLILMGTGLAFCARQLKRRRS